MKLLYLVVSVMFFWSGLAKAEISGCELLFDAIENATPLKIATILERPDVTSDCKDEHGNTALHYFACHRIEAIVLAYLVYRGKNILDQKNNNGETPFQMAERVGNIRAKHALLFASTPGNPVTIDGRHGQSTSSLPKRDRTCWILGK